MPINKAVYVIVEGGQGPEDTEKTSEEGSEAVAN